MQTSAGFETYVFVERIGRNAAVLHPFPEHSVNTIVEALADAGIQVRPFGPDLPERGEAMYFEDEPFPDEVLGVIADSLTLRGIGAYAYGLLEDSIGEDDLHVFVRVGQAWPRAGRRVVLTRLHVGEGPDGPLARTWIFGAAADLEVANDLLSSTFDTEPVVDVAGMAAIEVRHPEFTIGLRRPAELMDEVFQVLGAAGFEGPAFCEDHTGGT